MYDVSFTYFILQFITDKFHIVLLKKIYFFIAAKNSPSLTGKKSNELIQGGISSIKHAATSVAKKLDEIKEAISANSTPVKGALDRDHHHHTSEDDLLVNDHTSRSRRVSGELDLWGRLSESRKSSYNNLVPLGENTTSNNLNAYPTLPDSVYPSPNEVRYTDTNSFIHSPLAINCFVFFCSLFHVHRTKTIFRMMWSSN